MPTHDRRIAGVLLAAGKGTRFDPSGASNKLLQPAASGKPLVVAAADALLDTLSEVVAVVRRHDDEVAAALAARGCRLAVCAQAERGMGASLACGLRQAADAAGWIIALGDMPYVRAATVAALADALHAGAGIAAPVHDGRRGNPVGFGRRHLPALLQSDGDQGARGLLRSADADVVMVPVEDAGIHRDVDTPADLED